MLFGLVVPFGRFLFDMSTTAAASLNVMIFWLLQLQLHITSFQICLFYFIISNSSSSYFNTNTFKCTGFCCCFLEYIKQFFCFLRTISCMWPECDYSDDETRKTTQGTQTRRLFTMYIYIYIYISNVCVCVCVYVVSFSSVRLCYAAGCALAYVASSFFFVSLVYFVIGRTHISYAWTLRNYLFFAAPKISTLYWN